MESGIYKIIDLKGEFYIGSSNRLYGRKKEHFRELKNNKHDNSKLQNYYNKYGKGSLFFEVIEYAYPDVLLQREQYYIDTLKPKYNHCKVAGKPPSWKGKKHKPESIDKIKKSTWKHSPETLAHLKWLRENTDMNQRRSESLKKTYAITGGTFKGKKHKPEFGIKMSELLTGKKRTEESKARMRAAQKGRKASEETKLKMSKAQKSRKHSPETLERLKLAAKKRFENPEYRQKQLIHLKKLSEAKRKNVTS